MGEKNIFLFHPFFLSLTSAHFLSPTIHNNLHIIAFVFLTYCRQYLFLACKEKTTEIAEGIFPPGGRKLIVTQNYHLAQVEFFEFLAPKASLGI